MNYESFAYNCAKSWLQWNVLIIINIDSPWFRLSNDFFLCSAFFSYHFIFVFPVRLIIKKLKLIYACEGWVNWIKKYSFVQCCRWRVAVYGGEAKIRKFWSPFDNTGFVVEIVLPCLLL